MNSNLTNIEIESFWLRCYLNPSSCIIDSVISRAYRDFNRTLHGISKTITVEGYCTLKSLIRSHVDELLVTSFKSQEAFDLWHESKCQDLVLKFQEVATHILFIGQAQKWINMTFKYLFALGDQRVTDIGINYRFFHVPIDNIIQEEFKQCGIPKIEGSWSRIEKYQVYLNYQRLIRVKFVDQIPMDVEFRLFNKSYEASLLRSI